MRLSTLRALTTALTFAASHLTAQDDRRPDLSGVWSFAAGETPTTLPAAPGPVMGARFSLKTDAKALTLGRPFRDASFTSTLPFDGSRVATRVPGRLCEGERTFHETATWEGEALVITTVGITPPGGAATTEAKNRLLLRLDGPDKLVVEGTMVQQGERKQVGSVYRRSTDALPPPRPAHAAAAIPAAISQVAWIGANWTGTSGPSTTEERWTPPAAGAMMATARTLRGTALANFEFLCIAERDGSLAYVAMPDARTPATLFMLTAITPTSATFENPAHDYPKMIRYSQTADGSLETTIAGASGARSQTVVLKKAP